jgi:asparagine synthase (glutamine-hydrolysing)
MEGMEIRTPFLNKEIISFACNLPKKYKIRSYFDKKENKYILKKILSRYIPAEMVYQKKMGF